MKFRLSAFIKCASLAACAALASCATVPQPLQGNFTQVTPRDAASAPQPGTQVRWGGSIVETTPGPDATCFQLISRPLGDDGRPAVRNDATGGRFIVCHPGFYDPAVFAPGREVTITGKISGSTSTKIGDYDYPLPKVDADVIYLWPQVSNVIVRPYPYYDPYWGPRPYWGGWGWRGGYW